MTDLNHFTDWHNLVFLSVVAFAVILLANPAQAQTEPDVPDSEQVENSSIEALQKSAAKATRSSPFSPPESDDETFVADDGPFLDTGCTFRNNGPLRINIPVSRYVGEVDSEGFLEEPDKLVDEGLLPETLRITLPAFDVDFNASLSGGREPERDLMEFNREPVADLRSSNNRYLRGENDTWIKNTFEIPIGNVRFPDKSSGRVVNEVTIKIDVANEDIGEELWCTAVDWIAMEGLETAWRPTLLVHGLNASKSTWMEGKNGDISWFDKLNDEAAEKAEAITLVSDDGVAGLGSIQNNAEQIADRVPKMRNKYGVDKINIVSHSKGGLDSRHYARSHDDIEKLIMIGTPSTGSALATYAQGTLFSILGPGGSAFANFVVSPAGYQLTPSYMRLYNAQSGPNSKTFYVTYAGSWNPVGSFDGGAWLDGEDDLVVPVSSVHGLSFTVDNKISSLGAAFPENIKHTNQTESGTIFLEGEDTLFDTFPFTPVPASEPALASARPSPGTSVPNANQRKRNSSWVPDTWRNEGENEGEQIGGLSKAGRKAGPKSNSSPQQLGSKGGFVEEGNTQTHTFTIGNVDSASFLLFWGTDDLDLTLVDPDGNTISPSSAQNDQDVNFSSSEGTEGFTLLESFTVEDPVPGEWTARIEGKSVTSSSGEGYGVTALVRGSNVSLQAATNFDFYRNGDPMELQAEFTQDGSPVTGGKVAADILLPDMTKETLQLFDDGTNGDPTADDGVYYNTFSNTSQSGPYRISVSGEEGTTGKSSSSVSTLEQNLLVTVSESRSQFDGSFGDTGVDTDGNGLFNELEIQVGVDVDAAGDYVVTGQLEDGSGSVIGTASTEATLSSGAQTVTLSFSRGEISQNGEDGPFELTQLSLAEATASDEFLADFIQEAHTTSAYEVDDFERPDLFLTGESSDTGVDTDGNGLFDRLDVGIGVDVRESGNYEWSASLVDANGQLIDIASGSGNLSAGDVSIDLSFEGDKIGGNGVDGPYVIRDLAMFNTSTNASLLTDEVASTKEYSAGQFEGAPQGTLAGSVFYPTEEQSGLGVGRPLEGLEVEARSESGDVLGTATTRGDGSYQLKVGAGGPYEIGIDPGSIGNVLQGGQHADGFDLVRALQALLGFDPLVGPFHEQVADVDGTGGLQSPDLFQIIRFTSGTIGGFEAGPWAVGTEENVQVESGGAATGVDLEVAERGDVDLSGGAASKDGSKEGQPKSGPAALATTRSGTASLQPGETAEIPVRLEGGASVGAYALALDVPAEKIELQGVEALAGKPRASLEEGTLTVSWAAVEAPPLEVGAGEALAVLKVAVPEGTEGGLELEVSRAAAVGPEGAPLEGATLVVPGLEAGPERPEEFALKGSRPNPASGPARIEMDLPGRAAVTVEVYNTLGQRVLEVRETLAGGRGQALQLDGSGLSSGQYFYRVRAELGEETVRETGRLTVVR